MNLLEQIKRTHSYIVGGAEVNVKNFNLIVDAWDAQRLLELAKQLNDMVDNEEYKIKW